MNFEKFSERARGFVQAAQTIAMRESHQRFMPEHLLKALLDDDQGLAANLIKAAGGDPVLVRAANDAALAKLPKVEGGDQLYIDTPDRQGAGRGGEDREAGGRQLRHRRADADGARDRQVGGERRAESRGRDAERAEHGDQRYPQRADGGQRQRGAGL